MLLAEECARELPEVITIDNGPEFAEHALDDIEKAARRTPSDPGNYQANNHGIGLDLRTETGKDVYRRLVEITDIMIDGFSPRAMSSLNLDYSKLKKVKPDIIYVSRPALTPDFPVKAR